MKKFLKDNCIVIIMWLIFETVAVTLFLTLDNIFYLFNFTYIGTCIVIGIYLMSKKKKFARNFVQLGVGLYMLVYLGIICRENMQIEGFWYYLFLGAFEAATIHYFVAKIAGPLFFGRVQRAEPHSLPPESIPQRSLWRIAQHQIDEIWQEKHLSNNGAAQYPPS